MIVVVQGEVLCEECSDSLGLASRSAAATGGAQLPENDGGGTLSALTSDAGLAKEQVRVDALADEVRYGQAGAVFGFALLEQLESGLERRLLAAQRQCASVQAEIDMVLVKHAALGAEVDAAQDLARHVGEDAVIDPDAWQRAMLMQEELGSLGEAVEQVEDDLTVMQGGEVKLKLDKHEKVMLSGIALAFAGKSSRVALTTPPDAESDSPTIRRSRQPEPEPELEPEPEVSLEEMERRLQKKKRAGGSRAAPGVKPSAGGPSAPPVLVVGLFEQMDERKANLPALVPARRNSHRNLSFRHFSEMSLVVVAPSAGRRWQRSYQEAGACSGNTQRWCCD